MAAILKLINYKMTFSPALLLVLILVFVLNIPVFNVSGLIVNETQIVVTMSPGEIQSHQINVSMANTDNPVILVTSVKPLTQGIDGTPIAGSYTNNHSAVNYISIDKSVLRLNPGDYQTIVASIHIPEDIGDGGFYALIVMTAYNFNEQDKTENEIIVPVYITIKHSRLVHDCSLSGLVVKPLSLSDGSGAISTWFTLYNKGNHDFKFCTVMNISDNTGKSLYLTEKGYSTWTLLPGISRPNSTTIFPQVEIPAGDYDFTLSVFIEDGTVLASSKIPFRLTTTLHPSIFGDNTVLNESDIDFPTSNLPDTISPQITVKKAVVDTKRMPLNRVFLVITFFAVVLSIFTAILIIRHRKHETGILRKRAYSRKAEIINDLSPISSELSSGMCITALTNLEESVRNKEMVFISSNKEITQILPDLSPISRISEDPHPDSGFQNIGNDRLNDEDNVNNPLVSPSEGELNPREPEIIIHYYIKKSKPNDIDLVISSDYVDSVIWIVELVIENYGYELFRFYPRINSYLIVENNRYSPVYIKGLNDTLWGEIEVLDGKKIQGKLVFILPEVSMHSSGKLGVITSLDYHFQISSP